MFPWTPPLWLTVVFVATTIAINLITIVSKKAITKHLNGKQNNEPCTKNTAYWTHAIGSRIAILVNTITVVAIGYLLFLGMGWLCIHHPYILNTIFCVFMWIGSLLFVQIFIIGTKPRDNDAQENDTLIDPNDRYAINAYIAWILINVAVDAFMWLVTSHPWTTHY